LDGHERQPRNSQPSPLRLSNLSRQLIAEALGTAFLLAAIVGSGIMAERLSGANVGLALLCDSLATGAMLVVLITILGPVSGLTSIPPLRLHS